VIIEINVSIEFLNVMMKNIQTFLDSMNGVHKSIR